MRNIFLFIRRYANFFFFLFLEIVCIYTIVHYNRYHEAMFGSMANRITGNINKQYNKADYYLQLKRTNDSLVKANEMLYNKLKVDFGLPDTALPRFVDTIRVDSIARYRIFNFMSAKIIASTINSPANYVVLFGENVLRMRPGMGVIDISNGVIGVITEVDGKYAVVMSLLHKDSHLSGQLSKSGETGSVSWDGSRPNMLTLDRIPKSVKVAVGDSIITSGLSAIFPKGLLLGRVHEVIEDETTNYQTIKFRSAANFTNLQYGYAIENRHQEQLNKIQSRQKTQENQQ